MTQLNRCFLSAAVLSFLLGSPAPAASRGVEIEVLSGRADMVTGGDALVETNAAPDKIQRHAERPGHQQVFPSPAKSPGLWSGTLMGLKNGKNLLKSSRPRVPQNWSWPIIPSRVRSFRGRIRSRSCARPSRRASDAPLDDDCTRQDRGHVRLQIHSASAARRGRGGRGGSGHRRASSRLQAIRSLWSAPGRPRQTTTSDGKTVDYIVRRERGTINRAIYEIAMLRQSGRSSARSWTAAPAGTGGWCIRLAAAVRPVTARDFRAAPSPTISFRKATRSRRHP